MSLYDIQQAVHVAKDKRNEFGGYNYRTAEGILSAVKNSLPKGATIIVSDTLCEFAGQIFVSATATITLADNVSHSATGHAMHQLNKKGMDQAQITGAASSYARKYALAGLLALDDGSVDPDTQDNRKADEDRAKPARDARAVADSLLGLIAKQTTTGGLDRLNEEGSKFSAALDWLAIETPDMAAEVNSAWTDKYGALDGADFEKDQVG